MDTPGTAVSVNSNPPNANLIKIFRLLGYFQLPVLNKFREGVKTGACAGLPPVLTLDNNAILIPGANVL